MSKVLLIGGNGYIGSRIHINLKQEGHQVDVCDIKPCSDPNLASSHKFKIEMQKLSRSDIRPYEKIINLAAHSSVPQAESDPEGAIYNNIQGLQHLLQCIEDQILIYASSGSVYNGSGHHASTESDLITPSRNIYDLTKSAGDQMAAFSNKKWIALRFGTVNGVSPKMRDELIVNRMVKDSVEKGVLNLSNPQAFRGILALDDLVEAVSKITSREECETGIFNLGSFNYSIGEIASLISNQLSSSIISLPPTPTYDFSLSSAKFINAYNFKFSSKFESLVDQLRIHYTKLLD